MQLARVVVCVRVLVDVICVMLIVILIARDIRMSSSGYVNVFQWIVNDSSLGE